MPLPSSSYSPPKLEIHDFKGLNEFTIEHGLRTSEATIVKNCKTSNGALSRIKGFKPKFTANFSKGIGTIMTYHRAGTSTIIVASGGKLYEETSTDTFKVIESGFQSDLWDFVNFEIMGSDVIIMSNGMDNIKVYDGTTIRDLKYKGYSSGAGESNKAPIGSCIELHYGRLWVADSTQIYFSTANKDGYDPDDFTIPVDEEVEINQHGGFIAIPTWDGGSIIGLKTIFDDVVVFKNRNIFKVLGTYPGEYEVKQLFSTNGAIADGSIVADQNVAYFLDITGIYIYDGMNVIKISHAIKDTISRINKDKVKNSVGCFFRDSYFLAVPVDGSLVNNLLIEYNTVKKDFLLHELSDINSLIKHKEEFLFSDSKGMVYKMFEGDKFIKLGEEPQNINSVWETGSYDLGNKNARKSTEYLYFAGSGDGDIKVTCITERGERSTRPITLGEEQIHRVKLKNKGRTIKLRFENIDGANFEISSPELSIDLDFD